MPTSEVCWEKLSDEQLLQATPPPSEGQGRGHLARGLSWRSAVKSLSAEGIRLRPHAWTIERNGLPRSDVPA